MAYQERNSYDESEKDAFLPGPLSTGRKPRIKIFMLFTAVNLVLVVANLITFSQWGSHKVSHLNPELRQASTYSIASPH